MNLRKRLNPEYFQGQALRRFLRAAVVILFTTACQFNASSDQFSAQDLIALDLARSNSDTSDILALYERHSGSEVSIRIDMFDLSEANPPAFHIVLDTFPGSALEGIDGFFPEEQWDTSLIIFPDLSYAITGRNVEELQEPLHVHFDYEVDLVRIDLPRALTEPPGPYTIAIASIDPVDASIMDTIGPVSSDAPAPAPIPIMLSFSNVFPAATPAQALRSWDGAHNGPAGERFGLRHLLEASADYEIPIVLTDLKQPTSLMGLQMLGADSRIQHLERINLISLPDVLPGSICAQANHLGWPEELLRSLRAQSVRMGYLSSRALSCSSLPGSAKSSDPLTGHTLLFFKHGQPISLDTYDKNLRASTQIYVITNSTAETLSSDGGLSFNLRRQMILGAQASHPGTIMLLSADFQRSFWGDPQSSAASLRWIAAHPWIQPVSLERVSKIRPGSHPAGLEGLERSTNQTSDIPSTPISLREVLPFHEEPGAEALETIAWYLLFQSHTTPDCASLSDSMETAGQASAACARRQDELQQALDRLLVARMWVQARSQGRGSETWLKEESDDPIKHEGITVGQGPWLVIMDPLRNRLEAIFVEHPNSGVIPIIWQPGLFDPLDEGIPVNLSVQLSTNHMLIHGDSSVEKGSIQLPIYLDFTLLQRGEGCGASKTAEAQLEFGCKEGPGWRMDIAADEWRFDSVMDSPSRWTHVEDPNQDMPAGHFLPLPLGRLTIYFDASFSIRLTITDE
jgi:hypothetical protein